jgi:hypothetical protein
MPLKTKTAPERSARDRLRVSLLVSWALDLGGRHLTGRNRSGIIRIVMTQAGRTPRTLGDTRGDLCRGAKGAGQRRPFASARKLIVVSLDHHGYSRQLPDYTTSVRQA